MSDSKNTSGENKITGGCYCGAIRYESDEPPISAMVCHCRECQRWTGSAFLAAVAFTLTGFRYTKGSPELNQSAPILERGFCPDCGSALHSRYLVALSEGGASRPKNTWISVGTLDKPEIVDLKFYCGVESQLPWVHFDDDLPCIHCDEDPDLINALSAAKNKGAQISTNGRFEQK